MCIWEASQTSEHHEFTIQPQFKWDVFLLFTKIVAVFTSPSCFFVCFCCFSLAIWWFYVITQPKLCQYNLYFKFLFVLFVCRGFILYVWLIKVRSSSGWYPLKPLPVVLLTVLIRNYCCFSPKSIYFFVFRRLCLRSWFTFLGHEEMWNSRNIHIIVEWYDCLSCFILNTFIVENLLCDVFHFFTTW